MIKKIVINNFRSHEHTVLELHEYVNVIVGRGQAGKTNIKRAVEWVTNNRPLGSAFVSWWADGKPTEVIIGVINPDGVYTVGMIKKGDGSAVYRINGPKGEAHKFKKMGSKVPEPVRAVLNLDAVNMQHQLDQPYLVTGSKGDISRAVNRVIQAEVADEWLTELNSRDTQNRQHVKALEAVIDTQQTAVNVLAPITRAEEWIVKAELEDNRIGVAGRRADNIEQLLANLSGAEAVVAQLQDVVQPLEQMVNMAEAVQAEIDAAEAQVAAIDNMWRSEQYVTELAGQYQRVADEYVALLEELGQCPTCLSPVDEHMVTQLKEEL
jgi:exonuclease SbcC